MLLSGALIGPYEILGPIGAGGMGEVYRARDIRLGRIAALKLLPDTLAADQQQLSRFRREAQLLASLNHPHIAAVYGLEEAAGRLAIALEFVDGEGLDTRLARGRLTIGETIEIARQIAEGLEAAHERGIVHRDLKPANVRLTADGTVKILDFGLAKDQGSGARDQGSGNDADDADSERANTPTIATAASLTRLRQGSGDAGTEPGMILGTAAYMAPEQARGKAVDKRADVWAFGVLLYEMVTGHRPFDGETLTDVLASVLTREPDLSAIPATTPAAVRTLIARCLQRDVKQRLRDIGEARIALSAPAEGAAPSTALPASRPSAWTRRGVLPGAALVALAIAFAAARPLWLAAPPIADRPLMTLGIDAGGDTTIAGVGWAGLNWVGPAAVLSPDGQSLVFIARGPSGGRWQLFIRRLDELKASPIAGTEGAYSPFFSPDGRSVGFFAGGRMATVALSGGSITRICPVEEARGGAWSEDGTIVFAPRPDGPLYRVSSSGGEPSQVTALDAASGETTHRWPQFLPGGKVFVFTAHGNAGTAREGDVIVQSANGRKLVQRGAMFGRYAASGHLLYVNAGKLLAAPFDPDRLDVTGRAVPVTDDIATAPISGTAQYDLSNTGVLVYRRARNPKRLLQWMDASGQVQPMRSVSAEYQEARFSRDGSRLLLTIGDAGQSDIWSYDIHRDALTRLTFSADNDRAGIWSPDGAHIIYASWRADVGTFNLHLQRAAGGGEPQRLTTSTNFQTPIAWHPGGRFVVFAEERRGTGLDLMLLPVDVDAKGDAKAGAPEELLATPATETTGVFSPDGKWFAYTSDESGRNEVYVRPFPGRGGKWQVSIDGAEWIEWRANGLFYGLSEEVVMRVPYRVDGVTFVAGKPELWMRIPQGVLWVDPPTTGTRAAAIRAEDRRSESVVLTINFFDELRRRASAAQ